MQTSQPVTATAPPLQPEVSGTVPNSHQQGDAFFISTDAFYQATLNSPSSPGRHISLSLTTKRKAEMITDFLDNSPASVDTGEWTVLGSGNLLLNLRRKGEKDIITREFKTDGDKLVYTGTEYGTAGLILWVKAAPQ
jgi:hypothetical protein